MTVIAQSGIFGFAPQYTMGVLGTPFYRHKAGDIDLAPVDDVRTGPPEIGGVPVPTIPYKAGSMATGGATLYPRLENTFGWLLYAAMGGYTISGSAAGSTFPELCLRRTKLTTTTQTLTSGFLNPPSGVKLVVKAYRDGSSTMTGNVIISGTTSGSATQETVAIVDRDVATSTNTWVTVTSIQLPARTNTDGKDNVSIGWADATVLEHKFAFDSTRTSFVPWMSFRKLIPANASTGDPALGEQFIDCKVVGLTFTLPNEGLIQARVDSMGRTFEFQDNPENWTWNNTYEDYTSIPIGCTVGGYISVPSFGDSALPVVNCTVGIQNQPLDPRMERIFGSTDLEDVTIITRQLVFDVTCKWRDPSLYRAITTGSRTGTLWSTKPFVHSLDVFARSPDYITGKVAPHGLRVQSDSVMWQMAGGVRLVGNQMVSVRLQGTALDTSGNYASMSLMNAQSNYNWPTS